MIKNPNPQIDISKCSDEELLLSKFWIQDSALYYEVNETRNCRTYKYTIENDELKKFSQVEGGCLRIFFFIVFIFTFYPLTMYVISDFNLINCVILVGYYAGMYFKYSEKPEARSKMESVWKNHKDKIYKAY